MTEGNQTDSKARATTRRIEPRPPSGARAANEPPPHRGPAPRPAPPPPPPPARSAPPAPKIGPLGPEARYAHRSLLGEGGMGKIHLSTDKLIGRDVAMKVLRSRYRNEPEVIARFVREARIQGQLEHPSIVPVYDLCHDNKGDLFFTMKRVRGKTLEQIIDGYGVNDPHTIRNYPQRRVLRAFSTACLAVDFGHTRGVLHRDLKPGNIMMGDHGEVYVLDWGLSKVVGVAEDAHADGPVEMPEDAGTRTMQGALLGTPGYMSPEQARGETTDLDGRSDVYALGAILYEVLALQPLHARGTVQGMMSSTVSGADARPSFRSPQRQIPPELDAICVKATRLDREQRFASARELHDAIDRYLDGEQDQQLMREMAEAHSRAAEVAAEYALAGGVNAVEERGRALREVARALALDPGNIDARRVLFDLLSKPPHELPDEERGEVDRMEISSALVAANLGTYYFAGYLALAGIVLWMGVRSWIPFTLFVSAVLATVAISFLTARGKLKRHNGLYAMSLAYAFSIGTMSTMFGPLFLVPGLAAASTMAHYVRTTTRSVKAVIMSVGLLAILVPLVLEALGLLPPSYEFRDGALVLLPRMHEFPPTATYFFLIAVAIAHLFGITLIMERSHAALRKAENRLHLYAWQLKQLVPGEARSDRPPR